jgi:hypothetical protein
MTERNPYAPSRASLATGAQPEHREGNAAWRDRGLLVLARDSSPPARCVKCNEPALEPTKNRSVYWHHPAVYLLILFNIIVYVVVALIVRKTAVVPAGLCAQHKRRRVLAITFGWLGALAGFFAIVAGVSDSNAAGAGALIGVGILAILLSAFLGLVFARVVYAKRIDERYLRLRGCGEPFLDSLPEFPG